MMSDDLIQSVRAYLDSGDRGFLTLLLRENRDSIEGQAVVRYLLQIKHWPPAPSGEFNEVLEHLFGFYPERVSEEPQTYVSRTAELILQAFDYECVVVVPEPRPEPKPNPGRVTSRPRMIREEDSEGGARDDVQEPVSRASRTRDLDTTGASERLKRTIAIQRNQS